MARDIPHYHGDTVRALFVVTAVLLVAAEAMGANLPLAPVGSIIAAIALILATGITNPAQAWIHFVNAFLAGLGAFIFGSAAIGGYQAAGQIEDPVSFTFTLAIALISLIALYLTTRTIRGMYARPLA